MDGMTTEPTFSAFFIACFIAALLACAVLTLIHDHVRRKQRQREQRRKLSQRLAKLTEPSKWMMVDLSTADTAKLDARFNIYAR